MFRQRLILTLLLIFSMLSGCSQADLPVGSAVVSIASRGASLGATVAVPEPDVLLAITEGVVEEDDLAEDSSINDCTASGNPQYESAVAALVNKARIGAVLPVLSEHALLTEAARMHSEEMACKGFLDHESPAEGTPEQRIESVGYSFAAVGETIAMGYESPDEVVDAWLESDVHREILLGEGFLQIGVGFAQAEDDRQTRYWTIILAAPGSP